MGAGVFLPYQPPGPRPRRAGKREERHGLVRAVLHFGKRGFGEPEGGT